MYEKPAPLVLVIDDEPLICEAVQDILEIIKIEVVGVNSGPQGLQYFEEHADRIDAVLLDVNLPLMKGHDVYERLRALDSTLPIILSSGYSNMNVFAQQDSALFFLPKPYTLSALQTLIQTVLPST